MPHSDVSCQLTGQPTAQPTAASSAHRPHHSTAHHHFHMPKHLTNGNGALPPSSSQVEAFDVFMNAEGLQDVMRAFHALCDSVNMVPNSEDPRCFYHQLRNRFRNHWKANHLFEKLDKRAEQRVYKLPPGRRLRTLVIGAGPCGLRMAIELAFLGCQTIIVEKRAYFSRKNVLYLWQFVTDDLVNLGAKHFCGQFCSGSISHTSIRTLQYILLKVALLLGVQVFCEVDFDGIIEPNNEAAGSKEAHGWRAQIQPSDHMLSSYEFDVLIGADGRRNNMPGFQRESTRCKMAIAVTANFERTYDMIENQVEELSGRSFHFNQEYFHQIQQTTGVLLENIVYYRDETNYFIMTPHRESLLKKGVLKENFGRSEELLHPDNVDQTALEAMVMEVANFCTKYQLQDRLVFSQNHYHHNDVSIFDFTTVKKSRNACRVLRRKGHQLFMALVGDSLSEPFWPLGTGCAHGFLSVFDTAWAVRCLASGQVSLLDVVHERECLYTLLKGGNLKDRRNKYTIEPGTRYKESFRNAVSQSFARGLIDSDDLPPLQHVNSPSINSLTGQMVATPTSSSGRNKRRLPSHPSAPVSPNSPSSQAPSSAAMAGQQLLFQCYNWFHTRLSRYSDIVQIRDLCQSWLDGKALLCLVHCFKPQLVHIDSLLNNPIDNLRLALTLLKEHFDVPPVLSAEEMLLDPIDRISLVYYLQALYNEMKHLEPARANHPEPKIQSRQDRIQGAQSQSHQKYVAASQSSGGGFIRSIVGGSNLLRRSVTQKVQSPTTEAPPVTSKGYLKRQLLRLKENEDLAASKGQSVNDTGTNVELAHIQEMSAIKRRLVQNKNASKPMSPAPAKKDKSVGRVSVPAVVRSLFTGGSKDNGTSPQSSRNKQRPKPPPLASLGEDPAASSISAIFSPGRQCRICGQVGILLVERAVLRDGSVVHRDCIRCSQCNVSMEPHECHILITPNTRPAVNNQTTIFEVRCSAHSLSNAFGGVSPTLVRLLQRRRTSGEKLSAKEDFNENGPILDTVVDDEAVLLRRKGMETSVEGESSLRSISCDRHSMQLEIPSSRSVAGDSNTGNHNSSVSNHLSLSPRRLNFKTRHLSNSVEVLLEETAEKLTDFHSNKKDQQQKAKCKPQIVLELHRPSTEWMLALLADKERWWTAMELDPENGVVWKDLKMVRSTLLEAYFGSSEECVDRSPSTPSELSFGSAKINAYTTALSQCQVLRAHRLQGHSNGKSCVARKEWIRYRQEKKRQRQEEGKLNWTYSSDTSQASRQSSSRRSQLSLDAVVIPSTPISGAEARLVTVESSLSNTSRLSLKKEPEMVDHNKNNPSPPIVGIVGDGVVPSNKPCHEVEEAHIAADSSVTDTPISTPRNIPHKETHSVPSKPPVVHSTDKIPLAIAPTATVNVPQQPIAVSATVANVKSVLPTQILSDQTDHEPRQSSLPPCDVRTSSNAELQQQQAAVLSASAALRRMQFMMQPAKPVSIDSKSFIADMNRNRMKISTVPDLAESLGESNDFTARCFYQPAVHQPYFDFPSYVSSAFTLCEPDTAHVRNVASDYDSRFLLSPKSIQHDFNDSSLDMLVGMRRNTDGSLYQRSPSVCSIATIAAFNPFSFFGLDDVKDIDSISMVTEFDLPDSFVMHTTTTTATTISASAASSLEHHYPDYSPYDRKLTRTPTGPIMQAPVFRGYDEDDISMTQNSISIAAGDDNTSSASSSSEKSSRSSTPSVVAVVDCSRVLKCDPCATPTMQSTPRIPPGPPVPSRKILQNDSTMKVGNFKIDQPLSPVSAPPVMSSVVDTEAAQQKFLSLSWQKRAMDHLEDFTLSSDEEEDKLSDAEQPVVVALASTTESGNNNNALEDHKPSPKVADYLSDSASNPHSRNGATADVKSHLAHATNRSGKHLTIANSKAAPLKSHKKRNQSSGGGIFSFFRRGVSKSHGNLTNTADELDEPLPTVVATVNRKSSQKESKKKRSKKGAVESAITVPNTQAAPPSMELEQSEQVLRAASTDALEEALLWRPHVSGQTPDHNKHQQAREFSSPESNDSSSRRRRRKYSTNPYITAAAGEVKASKTHRRRGLSLHLSSDDRLRENNHTDAGVFSSASNPSSDDPVGAAISGELKKLKRTLQKSFRTLQAQVKAQAEEERRDSHIDLSGSTQQLNERERMEIAIHRQRQEQEATIMQRSQDVQCEKEEIEQSLQKLTETGKQLEQRLRSGEKLQKDDQHWPLKGNSSQNNEDSREEHNLLNEWFEIVAKQKQMEQLLNELHIQSKEIELEYRQSRLLEEYRLRQLYPQKTSEERRRDRDLLEEYIRLIEERDTLIALLDQQHQSIKRGFTLPPPGKVSVQLDGDAELDRVSTNTE